MRSSYRLTVLIAALGLSVASAGSKQTSQNQGQNPGPDGANQEPQAPQAPMDATAAMGLWKSNFGAVKIEADPELADTIRGVWLYERNGQEVIGYFAGGLSGNMLQFSWEEPSTGAPMSGGGYLMFDPQGQSFQGKWWTSNRDRGGNWSGWRGEGGGAATDEPPPNDPNDPNDLDDPSNPEPAPHEPGSDFI